MTPLIVRSVARGRRALLVGPAMAIAVAGIDLVYATAGFSGTGRVLATHDPRLALGLTSAAILIFLGCRTLRLGIRASEGLESPDEAEPDVVRPENLQR